MTEPSAEKAHIALDVLTGLSERSTDGKLRDAIALVRSAMWDELDADEVQELAGQTAVSQDLTDETAALPCCNEREPDGALCAGMMRAGWPEYVCTTCRARCGARAHPLHLQPGERS